MYGSGYYEKEELYDSIVNFIRSQKEKSPDESLQEIVGHVMQAVSDGLQRGIEENYSTTAK